MVRSLALGAILSALTASGMAVPHALADSAPRAIAHRIISLNPSLTSILVALGAGELLVGVDSYSARQEPSVARLPQVGGLYDPSLEAMVALAPDLVVLVPSVEQRELRTRLRALRVNVLEVDPHRIDDVIETIAMLGTRVDRDEAARIRIESIRATRTRLARASVVAPQPRVVLVLERDPLFVVGAGSFIDEMLRLAGAVNLGAELGTTYPRTSLEWLVERAPDVLLDASGDPEPPAQYWRRWSSLPAVRSGRVTRVDPALVTLPGPWLDAAMDALATAVRGAEQRLTAPAEGDPPGDPPGGVLR